MGNSLHVDGMGISTEQRIKIDGTVYTVSRVWDNSGGYLH